MRKAILAAAAGVLLIAGQAMAVGAPATGARVADRIGASVDVGGGEGGIPILTPLAAWFGGGVAGTLIGTVIIFGAAYAVVEVVDDSDS